MSATFLLKSFTAIILTASKALANYYKFYRSSKRFNLRDFRRLVRFSSDRSLQQQMTAIPGEQHIDLSLIRYRDLNRVAANL